MTLHHLGHRRHSLAVSLTVMFCLLFAGMRVPDLSRPTRPKPNPKAVLECQTKESQSSIKKSQEFVAVLPCLLECSLPLPRRTEPSVASPGRGVSPLFPHASRAPPVVLS